MFHQTHPRDTLTRTRRRLDQRGSTHSVALMNALDWGSLALHHALPRILMASLAIAVANRLGVPMLQYLLLIPLAYVLVFEPLVRAGSAMHRQLDQHRHALQMCAATVQDATRER